MKASFKTCLFFLFAYFTFLTLFVYGFSNFNLKHFNVMYCHELNEQNDISDDKGEEYEENNEVP